MEEKKPTHTPTDDIMEEEIPEGDDNSEDNYDDDSFDDAKKSKPGSKLNFCF